MKTSHWYLGRMVAIAGLLVMAGWIFNLPILTRLPPDMATMKFVTAVGFVVAGVMLDQLRHECNAIATSCAMCLLWLSLLVAQFNGIIELPFSDMDVYGYTLAPGVPSVTALLAFALLGAYGVVQAIHARTATACHVISGVVIFIGLLSIAGYVLHSVPLIGYIPGRSSAMALHTAILFVLCGVCAWRNAR